MREFFYKSATILKFIPFKWFLEITGQKSIFPFYHLISDEDVLHVKHLYKVRSIREFENDLEFLLKEYKPLDIPKFIDFLKNGSNPGANYFLLTFDDGLREFHDVIAPILLRKGIPAVCFLNSGFVDNKDLFYRYKASLLINKLVKGALSPDKEGLIRKWCSRNKLIFNENGRFLLEVSYFNRFLLDELACILEFDFHDYLVNRQPYLTSGQITGLQSKGFHFGAHSVDHPLFSALTFDQQMDQTRESLKFVENNFHSQYNLFSFPFTDHGITNKYFQTIFDEEGSGADLTFGCAGLKNDSCHRNIQRISMEIENLDAGNIIYGEYLYYMLKAMVNKNNMMRH